MLHIREFNDLFVDILALITGNLLCMWASTNAPALVGVN